MKKAVKTKKPLVRVAFADRTGESKNLKVEI
jgi:hypothetical protein